uniref:Uncharacterized protein n=1 Tax=Trichogramma kaykai TaxID=54128 RepID=A0ABD2X177_9HYME
MSFECCGDARLNGETFIEVISTAARGIGSFFQNHDYTTEFLLLVVYSIGLIVITSVCCRLTRFHRRSPNRG